MHGHTQVVAVPKPAAGAGFTVNVSGSTEWVPRSLVFTLTCSADVANRYVTVEYREGTGVTLCVNAAGLVFVANDVFRLAFSSRRGVGEWATGTDVLVPLEPLNLPDECSIVCNVANMAAADQLSGIVLAVEQRDLAEYVPGYGLAAVPAGAGR